MKKKLYITAAVIGIFLLLIKLPLHENTLAQNAQTDVKYQLIYIESGDTLWSIASKYVPDNEEIRKFIYEIRQLNDIEPSKLQPGQVLKIPVGP